MDNAPTRKNTAHPLKQISPRWRHLVAIDSDGCVFDSMEVKQKECFCPRFIQHFALQAVSKYAREAWEFVNLYSATRGINRFRALLCAVELLAAREEVQRRATPIPRLPALAAWVARESKCGNTALQRELSTRAAGSPARLELERVLNWSLAVDAAVEEVARGVPPFCGVTEALAQLSAAADIIVVSQAPQQTIAREWREQGIADYAAAIVGQEQGKKDEHLLFCTAHHPYSKSEVLMVGDAPGDYAAARTAGVGFFPIVPGQEEESWRRLRQEAIPRFLSDDWPSTYQEQLVAEFLAQLPQNPPWATT